MKIALLGEMSGVHLSLKKGFVDLGHEVDLYSSGDGFKNIPNTKPLIPLFANRIDQIRHYYELPSILKHVSTYYDAIQIINPHFIPIMKSSLTCNNYFMAILKKSTAYKSLAVVGCENKTPREVSTMSRSPCSGCLKDSKLQICPFLNKKSEKISRNAIEFADSIIPFGGFAYSASYSDIEKRSELLPFPVDADLIPFSPNCLGQRIRILHGINRAGFKGTDIIMRALQKVKNTYPDSFEIVEANKLPFLDYLKLLSTVNVVIDQLYGDALGMNALFSMASGRMVFSSFEIKRVGQVNLLDVPAKQIGTSVDKIFSQVSELRFLSASDFENIGEQSRQYVEHNCSPIKVASAVVKIWKNSKILQ